MHKAFTLFLIVVCSLLLPVMAHAQTSEGSIAVEGTIPTAPPATPATISSPANGAVFSDLPITVQGICTGDLIVKLFRNGVFAGSAQCQNGSYSIETDLFSGQNELVAIVFDALDQEGPPSNTVIVTYNDQVDILERVSLTSNYARRGANPKQKLIWPVIVSGGSGPYAISVDWGDSTDEDLLSVALPGEFEISHKYENAGVYTVIVKATDSNGQTAYLQLVAVANGELSSTATGSNTDTTNTDTLYANRTKTKVIWEPILIVVPFVILTFWLGTRHQLKRVRAKIEAGQLPFNLR
ncbi:PKD domain-containing protein [Candidatus Saccharibacteria bacterium]|nr:PKD domain-containing protein [Candidatus Saccharibacteria bacterium]